MDTAEYQYKNPAKPRGAKKTVWVRLVTLGSVTYAPFQPAFAGNFELRTQEQ